MGRPNGGRMRRQRFRSSSYLAIFAACLAMEFFTVSANAQQTAQEKTNGLTVEKIYSRPGLTAPLARGIEWSPDGKLLSYFRSSGTGAAAKTDLYAMDAANPELPGRLLVDSGKLKELLPPSRKRDTQATGLGRVAPEQYEWAPRARRCCSSPTTISIGSTWPRKKAGGCSRSGLRENRATSRTRGFLPMAAGSALSAATISGPWNSPAGRKDRSQAAARKKCATPSLTGSIRKSWTFAKPIGGLRIPPRLRFCNLTSAR